MNRVNVAKLWKVGVERWIPVGVSTFGDASTAPLRREPALYGSHSEKPTWLSRKPQVKMGFVPPRYGGQCCLWVHCAGGGRVLGWLLRCSASVCLCFFTYQVQELEQVISTFVSGSCGLGSSGRSQVSIPYTSDPGYTQHHCLRLRSFQTSLDAKKKKIFPLNSDRNSRISLNRVLQSYSSNCIALVPAQENGLIRQPRPQEYERVLYQFT